MTHSSTTTPARRRGAALLLAVAVALLVAGCSGAESSDSTASSAVAAPPDAGADAAMQNGAAGGATGAESLTSAGEAAAPAGPAIVQGRISTGGSIVRTGELDVEVDDVSVAADEAVRLATGAGGRVDSDDRGTGDNRGRAVLLLRLPPQAFDATLTRLSELGDEQRRSLGSEDVTEQIVDLDARLTTQRASVARVRALLDRANTIGEIVQVEGELTKRTADLEALQARLDAVQERVDLSTITLRLTGESERAAPGAALGFGDGLSGGWDALGAIARAAAVAVGALLPFSPVLLLVAFVLWRQRSRRTLDY